MTADVIQRLQSGLTVADLIAQLSDLPPQAIVIFTADYGDRSHTQQVFTVRSAEEFEESIDETAYSNSGLGVTEYEDGEEISDGGHVDIVILRS
jgi:hypothetical protein